jgi:tight adherence protein C
VETFAVVFGIMTLLAGAGAVALALAGSRRPATDPADYLRQLDADVDLPDAFQERLAEPFVARVLKPLGSATVNRLVSVTPSSYLDRIHGQLLHAGLTGMVRAEDFVAAQGLATAFGLVVAVGWAWLAHPPDRMAVLALLLLPAIGAICPSSWLSRRVRERKEAILKDLPDVLDLLAISVEAGVGFEGAMAVVCQNFTSPIAEEFSRTLREMELGLPRREALQNLKRRTEVPELSNFVLVLTQADALGMPIGRVLRTQAAEMRSKRRQWAREKAGKLPVKILFPLVVFIFPAVLVVLLGPAVASVVGNL